MFQGLTATLWVFVCLFSTPVLGQPFCSDVYGSKPKLPENTEVTVYRFYSHETNNHATSVSYHLIDGMFYPKDSGVLGVAPSFKAPNNSFLLGRLQNYSTHIMEKGGYISKEVKERQPGLLDNSINPAQVTFLEMTRPVDIEVVKQQPEKFPQDVISDRPDINQQLVHVREAGMWLVSGQYLWPYSREAFTKNKNDFGEPMEVNWNTSRLQADKSDMDKFNPYRIDLTMQPMPWQVSKKVMDNTRLPISIRGRSIVLDRQRFPIVFELGRVAQSEPGRFRELIKMAANLMAYETHFTMQGQLTDAYVFVNTMSPLRAQTFKRMGFEILKEACLSASACILYMRLDKLIERHALETNSYRYGRLKGLFPQSNLYDVQNLLSRVFSYFRSDLDFLVPELNIVQRTPVVIHDYSANYETMLVLLAMKAGRSFEDAKLIAKELSLWKYNYVTRGRGYQGEVPSHEFQKFYTENNLIRITNVTEGLAKNRDSIEVMLMALENFLYSRYIELNIVKSPEDYFSQVPFDYIIQTPSKDVAAHLRRHGYQEVPVMYDSKGESYYGFVIPRAWVKSVGAMNPHLTDLLKRRGLDQGYWFFRALNANPMQF